MRIIIPMTGNGYRFVAAGYTILKPVIPVLGIPMLEWIIKGMYDPEKDDFLLICREEHFLEGKLDEGYLQSLAKKITIVKIRDWIKKGPVYDILRSKEYIDDSQPCIVNYCDFYAPWNWREVKERLTERDCEGAVIGFTGFQPCLVPEKNVYASCLCDENNDLIEIREKFCFEQDKFKGIHSTGTYYFKSGKLLKKYYQETIDRELMLNGEYYASLPYNLLLEDGLKVWVPVFDELFYTLGTPEDLEEFEFWMKMMKGWASV